MGSIWEGMKESKFEGFPPLMVHCLGWCPIMTSGFHTPHCESHWLVHKVMTLNEQQSWEPKGTPNATPPKK